MKFPYNKVLDIKKSYQDGHITREEAKEELAYLLDLKDETDFCVEPVDRQAANGWGEHWRKNYASYGPLVRLSDVCNILRMWANLHSQIDENTPEYRKTEKQQFHEHWSYTDIQISKSNALARWFFTDEGVRNTPCPTHKGTWSGCFSEVFGQRGPCACQSGGNITGFLAEDKRYEDLQYWDDEKKEYRRRDEESAESPRIL
jgi:hypothetical protein